MKRCLIHNWYHGTYQTGFYSLFTGDHVGRSEIRCLDCNVRGIFLSSYSKEHQKELIKIRKVFKHRGHKYIQYTSGDAVDVLTKKWIEESGSVTKQRELCY